MDIVKLTERGVNRVLHGRAGMTFPVHKYTATMHGRMNAHVRDYRFTQGAAPYQIWTLGPGDYIAIQGETLKEQ